MDQDQEIMEGKALAILSYLFILCIIPLLLKKENRFVLFHGKQGLIIFVCEVAVFIVHIVVGQWILDFGIFLFGLLSLIGIVGVLRGRYLKIPVIAEIAERVAL